MRRRFDSEAGQYLVYVAILMPVLIAMLGLVADVGNAYLQHRAAQNAADAAATAAAAIIREGTETDVRDTAKSYTARHGYLDSQVTVNWPPVGGDPAYQTREYVQVQIRQNVRPIFLRLIWNGTWPVVSRATAGTIQERLGPSVLVLDEDQCEALRMTGNTGLTVTRGNVHVNSNCSTAVSMSGTCNLTSETPTSIVGNYYIPGGADNMDPFPPITHAGVLPDPLAGIPAPDFAGRPIREDGTAANPQYLRINSGNVRLRPGIYYGGIVITGGNVTLDPGEYIMAGGGFKVTGNADITGEHVMFYITEDPTHPTGDGEMGQLILAGTGDIILTPPESGTYAGMLFFQDRANTMDAHISGTSSMDGIEGIIYMANAPLVMSGTMDVRINFVVQEMTFTGTGMLTVEGFDGEGWSKYTTALVE